MENKVYGGLPFVLPCPKSRTGLDMHTKDRRTRTRTPRPNGFNVIAGNATCLLN